MEAVTWHCEYCTGSSSQLQTQDDFVQHLYTAHFATEKSQRDRTQYIRCKYGPDGVCKQRFISGQSESPTNGTSVEISGDIFESEQAYQSHIVRYHLYHPSRRKRQIGVSSIVIPDSALTYHEITGDRGSMVGSSSNDAQYHNTSAHNQVSSTPPAWTVYHSQVNLAAVLNDPKHRQIDIFSRTWGDSFERAEVVPSPYLPPVTPRQFERYLSRVCSHSGQRSRNGQSARNQNTYDALQSQSELEVVPKYFFQSGFNLESPATFSTVLPLVAAPPASSNTPRSLASISPTRRQPLSTENYQPLHNKLSQYLDIVEIHIARQIARKSGSFFEAVSSHDTVRDKLDQTLNQVQKIRHTMKSLNQEVVSKHMKILRLARQKHNYEALYEKLKLVMTVHAAHPTIQTLLATSDFCGALDLIATTQDLVQNELAGLHCFRHLDAQLTEMARFVDKMVQAEFVQVVQQHLDYRESTHGPSEDDQLTPCLMGMLRINRLQFVDIYQTESSQRIKDVVKSAVVKAVSQLSVKTISGQNSTISSASTNSNNGLNSSTMELQIDSQGPPANPTLAEQMRQLEYYEWMVLLKEICERLSDLLQRIIMGCDLLSCAITRCASGCTDITISLDPAKRLTGELLRLNTELVNTAQERLVKVLNARAKDGFLERLSPAQFVALTDTLNRFQKSLGDGGNSYPLLRSTQQSFAVRLVTRFHEERRTKLTLILDNERWKATEVPTEFQTLADYLKSHGQLGFPTSAQDSPNGPPASVLVLNDRRFVVAGTVLLLFKMIVEYCQCAQDIQTASRDVLLRMVELLKLFNSRTCQLVLGAGAIQLLGMKTISTRNLALASSCLQLVLSMLPQIRQHFSAFLSTATTSLSVVNGSVPTQAPQQQQPCPLKHLDQVEKLYRDHVTEIGSQLVVIMDRNAASTFFGWRVRPPVPSQEMRTVCTQLTRLHEAIEGVLPADQITELFLRVHNKFKAHLRERLREQRVNNDSGPQHGLVMSELTFYMTRLRSLSGLGKFQEDFEDLWQMSHLVAKSDTASIQPASISGPVEAHGGLLTNQNIITDSNA